MGGGGGGRIREERRMAYIYDDSMNIVIHICTCRIVVVHAHMQA